MRCIMGGVHHGYTMRHHDAACVDEVTMRHAPCGHDAPMMRPPGPRRWRQRQADGGVDRMPTMPTMTTMMMWR